MMRLRYIEKNQFDLRIDQRNFDVWLWVQSLLSIRKTTDTSGFIVFFNYIYKTVDTYLTLIEIR